MALVLSASGWSLTRQLRQTAVVHLWMILLCAGVSQSLPLPVSIFVGYVPTVIKMNHEIRTIFFGTCSF